MLNTQQETAVSLLSDFIKNNKNFFLLEGIPGSGKTYVVSQFLLSQDSFEPDEIIILTPTHQAKKVINQKTNGAFECATIHSFLGLTKKINTKGESYYSSSNKKQTTSKQYKLVVVDECSMINQKCYMAMMKLRSTCGFKYIFLGDKNQLPPINEEESIVFELENKFRLTENVRNANDIYDATMNILTNIDKKMDFFKKPSKNVNIEDELVEFYEKIDENIAADKNMIFLCWTNIRRKQMNKYMRKSKYGETPDKYNVGEDLIVMGMFTTPNDILLPTNEIIKIKKIETITKDIEEFKEIIPPHFMKYFKKKLSQLKLWKLSTDEYYIYDICDEHKKIFEDVLDRIGTACAKYKKKKYWESFFKIKEYFLPNVDYAYALTVHRSQGSEWDVVFLDVQNINKNNMLKYKNKLIYVGVSRAKQGVYILK